MPRCSCPEHGINPIHVLWAEPGSPITGLVECSDRDCMREAGRAGEGGGASLLPSSRWDHATRRSFIASTVGAVGSLFAGGVVLPKEVAGAKVTAARAAELDWGSLRRRIKGEVVTANAPDFAAVRSALVWNQLKPDRSPDAIVRVKNEHDVVEAVNFARENGLRVVARGGGHAWCGLTVRMVA